MMENNPIDPHEVRLDDETLTEAETARRQTIGARVLALVPPEAIDRLQILQPAIGCLNRCNFCSQVAGPITRELDAESLRAIMGGLRGAMHSMGVDHVGAGRAHKEGIIFPYMDNDIGSYPHLIDYLIGMRSLGGRTRISTVGWSRHSKELQTMHETIATRHSDDIDGVRFSFTPYTIGWRTNREEYLADFANALATYRPFFEQKGVGRRTACIEMRFAPDIRIDEVEHGSIGEYRIVRCAEYTLVTRRDELAAGGISAIASIDEDGPRLNQVGADALQLIGVQGKIDESMLRALFTAAPANRPGVYEACGVLAQKGRAHTFRNSDGLYVCFNPLRERPDDGFSAIHYYPRTAERNISGVLDATRPFLNALLRAKAARGIGPRDDFEQATDMTVQEVLADVAQESAEMRRFSPERSAYIERQVIPLIEGMAQVMRTAGFAPSDFFRYGLVVDTGIIVNQGKAITEFRGLASRPDMPMTPNEEKGYGDVSQSSVRGNTWRISPVSVLGGAVRAIGYGRKSLPVVTQRAGENDLLLGVHEWNPQTFNNTDTHGSRLRSIHVPIGDVIAPLRTITPADGKRERRIPGT